MRRALAIVIGLVLFSSGLIVLVPQESSAVLPSPHDPIRIDNDTEFATMATAEGWQGDGTLDGPYVIGYLDISGGFTTDPIYIGNTTVYFIIDTCVLWEANDISWPYLTASGVTLYNVTNGEISSNQIADVIDDITLIHCADVRIESNILRCTGDAIAVYNSERTQIVGNDFAYSTRGIQSEMSNNSMISVNTFLTFSEFCVVLGYSDNNIIVENDFKDCSYHIVMEYADGNTIRNCNFSSGVYGIQMTKSNRNMIAGNTFDLSITDGGAYISDGTNNSVEDNSFGPSDYGVNAELAHDLTVRNNTFPNNYVGINVKDSNRAVIEENTCDDDWEGVFLENSDYFIIVNNSITQCGTGIELLNSDYGEIRGNNCSANDITGMYTTESHYNLIRDNDFSGSAYGIWLSYGDSYDVVRENNCTSNGVSGMLISDAHDNIIVHNIIKKSASFGLYIAGSTGNSVYFNIFVQNNGAGEVFDALHRQAWDDSNLNQWDLDDGFGNYWRDWRTPDSDNNGIVDLPYELYGMGVDHYPLTSFVSYPRNLAITVGEAYANLSWDAPNYTAGSSVKYYKIYRENPGGSVSVVQVQGDVTAYGDTSVQSWKTYLYHVTAVNIYGEGPASNEIEVLVPDYTNPSVTISSPENNTYGKNYSMPVKWTGIDVGSGISHYEIRLDSGPWVNVENDTNYTFASLSNGTHVVKVMAIDNASNIDVDSVTFKIGIGRISGQIMSGGQPIAGTNVSLDTGEQTVTDGDGYFAIDALAGPHTITFDKQGYDRLTREVTLEPGPLMDLGQMEMKKSGIDLMWAIVAIVVIAAVATLIVVVLRARRH